MAAPLIGPSPTLLPEGPDDQVAQALAAGGDPGELAARHPDSSLAWAELAERALLDPTNSWTVQGYAFARTGYHRGLDALRRAGWRGVGPVPWAHEANRGFLRALRALGVAARRIGEDGEATRCQEFLDACDPAVPAWPA